MPVTEYGPGSESPVRPPTAGPVATTSRRPGPAQDSEPTPAGRESRGSGEELAPSGDGAAAPSRVPINQVAFLEAKWRTVLREGNRHLDQVPQGLPGLSRAVRAGDAERDERLEGAQTSGECLHPEGPGRPGCPAAPLPLRRNGGARSRSGSCHPAVDSLAAALYTRRRRGSSLSRARVTGLLGPGCTSLPIRPHPPSSVRSWS